MSGLSRRQALVAAGAMIGVALAPAGRRSVAAAPPLGGRGLLAPASYGHGPLLAALGGKQPLTHQLLEQDADALDRLVPLPPDASDKALADRPRLVVSAHPWTRGLLWPEGLIDAVAVEQLPPTPGRLSDSLPPLASLETGLDGHYHLGRAVRFDLAAPLVHQDRISVGALADGGLDLLNDDRLKGRIGLRRDPRSLLAVLMAYAGLNPFRVQLPSELARFAQALTVLKERVALVSDQSGPLIKALNDGQIDLVLPMGQRHLAPVRLADPGCRLALAPPGNGPVAGHGAFTWVEILSRVMLRRADPLAVEALQRAGSADFALNLMRAGHGLAPVVGLLDGTIRAGASGAELAALDWDNLPDRLNSTAPLALIPDRAPLAPLVTAFLDGLPSR